MTPLMVLARFAARQHDLVTTEQLRTLGFSKEAIRHLVRSQRIFRVHRGVFAVGRPTLTRESRWLAAVLACTDGAALGRLSAAVHWQVLGHDSFRPEVIVPGHCSNTGPQGIAVFRSSDFTEEDVVVHERIRVTSVLRTLVDLSRSRLSTHSLNAAVRQAARQHHADLQQLRGLPRLERLVRLYDPLIGLTESELEALFFEMCRRYRLPVPRPQVWFGPFRADFVFEAAKLAIECQSRRWHDNDVNHVMDRKKERVIKAAGYELLPFAWAEVKYEASSVATEIRAAIARRARLVGLEPH
jgi:very-short-patch-repair endonuclease